MQINIVSIAGKSSEAAAPVAVPKSSSAAVASTPAAIADDHVLQAAVEQINRTLRDMNNSIQFEFDKGTGKTIVRVIDDETQDVLMQYPSEAVLAIARSLDSGPGLLLKELA